jgi:hypothetical protein
MNRPELVNEWMTDMVTTSEVSPTDTALFEYIMTLEKYLDDLANEILDNEFYARNYHDGSYDGNSLYRADSSTV